LEKKGQKKLIEALLFLSEEPVKADRIAMMLSISPDDAARLAGELRQELNDADRGLQIIETAGGFQLGTRPELAPYLEKAFSEDVSSNLTAAALEALAIIAYKQPVTRIEIESIRGVRCEHVLDNLIKRKLIKISGRKEGPGRPLLYSTTPDFLKYFGLMDLNELPPLDLENKLEQSEGSNENNDQEIKIIEEIDSKDEVQNYNE